MTPFSGTSLPEQSEYELVVVERLLAAEEEGSS